MLVNNWILLYSLSRLRNSRSVANYPMVHNANDFLQAFRYLSCKVTKANLSLRNSY